MISYLSGKIHFIGEKSLTLVVNGVGYEVFVNNEIISHSQIGEPMELSIHTAVKEDSITLYGFDNPSQLKFFQKLISVSGIGPRTGLEILNQPLHITKQAIFTEDHSMLTQIPGLGKKTAQRLILELKNKIEIEIIDSREHQSVSNSSQISEAVEALESLGYKRYHVMREFQKLSEQVENTEDLIKWFLARA